MKLMMVPKEIKRMCLQTLSQSGLFGIMLRRVSTKPFGCHQFSLDIKSLQSPILT